MDNRHAVASCTQARSEAIVSKMVVRLSSTGLASGDLETVKQPDRQIGCQTHDTNKQSLHRACSMLLPEPMNSKNASHGMPGPHRLVKSLNKYCPTQHWSKAVFPTVHKPSASSWSWAGNIQQRLRMKRFSGSRTGQGAKL